MEQDLVVMTSIVCNPKKVHSCDEDFTLYEVHSSTTNKQQQQEHQEQEHQEQEQEQEEEVETLNNNTTQQQKGEHLLYIKDIMISFIFFIIFIMNSLTDHLLAFLLFHPNH